MRTRRNIMIGLILAALAIILLALASYNGRDVTSNSQVYDSRGLVLDESLFDGPEPALVRVTGTCQ